MAPNCHFSKRQGCIRIGNAQLDAPSSHASPKHAPHPDFFKHASQSDATPCTPNMLNTAQHDNQRSHGDDWPLVKSAFRLAEHGHAKWLVPSAQALCSKLRWRPMANHPQLGATS
eukprot:1512988-Amphidinium_carterae.1